MKSVIITELNGDIIKVNDMIDTRRVYEAIGNARRFVWIESGKTYINLDNILNATFINE